MKALRVGACLLWLLALIILTNALRFHESGLSGQPSVAGDSLDPSLASHNCTAGVHVWMISSLKSLILKAQAREGNVR